MARVRLQFAMKHETASLLPITRISFAINSNITENSEKFIRGSFFVVHKSSNRNVIFPAIVRDTSVVEIFFRWKVSVTRRGR